MAYLARFSLETQIDHQLDRIIIEIHAARSIAMRVGIVAPSKYACVWNIAREEIAGPMNPVTSRPCLLAVAVQAMDNHDAAPSQKSYSVSCLAAYSTTAFCPSVSTLRPKGDDAAGAVVACGCSA
jgi:hypothetical protein